MPSQLLVTHDPRKGFTLTEAMVAAALSSLVIVAVYTALSVSSRMALAGRSQVEFNTTARLVTQKIVRYVEQGRAVGLAGNALDILTVSHQGARISFLDGDGDPGSVVDNMLVYDPDTSVFGDERVLCHYVSPLGTNPIFTIVATSPNSVRLCFHIGDGTNAADSAFAVTGAGYQGVEVRITATPRNLQRWYPD